MDTVRGRISSELPVAERLLADHSSAMNRPLLLLSNDDGHRAIGIHRLRAALAQIADVVICAPEVEQSAASHAISLHRPLRLLEHAPGVFAVDGTPADCVYTALYGGTRILPRRPDVVVSGLNHGVNLGDDVFYSGTVAAAREGALRGIPAIAFSATEGAELEAAAELARDLVWSLLTAVPPRPLLLNVNFPVGSGWRVRATRSGSRIYKDEVEYRMDPRGREYLWLGGPPGATHTQAEGTDTWAFDSGEVGVTPLTLSAWDNAQGERTRQLVATVPARPVGS